VIPGRLSESVAQREAQLFVFTVLQRTTKRVSNNNFEKHPHIPEKFKLTFVIKILSS
jgi:hypothetical protein